MKIKSLFALIVSTIILISCSSSSSLMSAWADTEVSPKSYNKLTVFAIFPNMQTRVTAEDALVKHLKAKGIQAQPSYLDFPLAGQTKQLIGMARDTNLVKMMKQNIRKKIGEKGIDAIMFMNAYNVEKTKEYHQGVSIGIAGPAYGYYPGYYGNVSPYAYRGSYYDYYAYAVGTVYSSGYYSTSTTYFLQTNLFDVDSENLIWAGQTKTVNYQDLEHEADVLGELLINDLAQKGVVTTSL